MAAPAPDWCRKLETCGLQVLDLDGSPLLPDVRRAHIAFAGGVLHDNDRHTRRFTVIGNHLAQHAGLSLLAIGLSVHVQSLPTGASVSIETLARRFPEPGDCDACRPGKPGAGARPVAGHPAEGRGGIRGRAELLRTPGAG
ncbi:hypothetical protein GCM10010275_10330 [Streptomyces litmocidini]|uniref:hypothetical protein n=1 Tax=Streptomyces litmocidini TaxID=67318 RepID=UPI00199A95CC|nr:hypothetical protein GCM10010275_10330 [Streptomyces litmocidini]